MIIAKGLNFKRTLTWTEHHVIWISVYMSSVAFLYHREILTVGTPWLPLSAIGTAVAFYGSWSYAVGFVNMQQNYFNSR